MRAEVIAIGDELISGHRVDTNSAWISERLAELGVPVTYHTTVGDDLEAMTRVLELARDRADIVICTGGLGPTADDLTRHALAALTGQPLRMDSTSLRHIQNLFARRARPMPAQNEIQAMFPVGSRVIPNPHGTAPGIDLTLSSFKGHSTRLLSLPGVPAEMREMWNATVALALRDMGAGRHVIRQRRIKCFGVGESELEQMLPDLIRRGRFPSVGITVHKATITLRITAEGADAKACDRSMGPTIQIIHDCLGDLVFGEQDDELHDVVAHQLSQRAATLSTVEWGTEGVIAHWLRATADAAGVYRGGMVVSSYDGLCQILGWDKMRGNCSERDCAKLTSEMAEHLRARMSTDFALAVGPRPETDSRESQPAEIHIALATRDGVSVVAHPFAGHPDILVERSAKQALNYLRLHLTLPSKGKLTH